MADAIRGGFSGDVRVLYDGEQCDDGGFEVHGGEEQSGWKVGESGEGEQGSTHLFELYGTMCVA